MSPGRTDVALEPVAVVAPAPRCHPDRPQAACEEVRVADAVVLEGVGRAVGPEGVDLDDEPAVLPQAVDGERSHLLVQRRDGQLPRAQPAHELALDAAAGLLSLDAPAQ